MQHTHIPWSGDPVHDRREAVQRQQDGVAPGRASRRNHVAELDEAAERLYAAAGLSPRQVRPGLIAWLAEKHGVRVVFDETDEAQRRYRGPLNELPRFAAGLFKGVVRAGTEAIVHRSPPVAGSGQTRLFLCLNEVHDDE